MYLKQFRLYCICLLSKQFFKKNFTYIKPKHYSQYNIKWCTLYYNISIALRIIVRPGRLDCDKAANKMIIRALATAVLCI